MAQSLPRVCPRCGAEAIPGQKFCRKCGLNMSGELPPQSLTQSSEQSAAQSSRPSLGPTVNPPSNPELELKSKPPSNARSGPVPKRPSAQATPPALGLPSARVSRPILEPLKEVARPSSEPTLAQASLPSLEPLSNQAVSSSPDEPVVSMPMQALPRPQVQGSPQSSMQTQMQAVPQASPALLSRSWDRKRIAIGLALIVVLGGVVFGILMLAQALQPPSQSPIITTPLGTTVNYAGVDITVVNAQKSQLFLDDPNSLSDGMLRLRLQAQNKTSLPMTLSYETITHVTLPNGKVVGPTYVKFNEHVAPNATVSGLVDFAVPQDVRVNQVIFHLGSADEAQLDIPLNGHANEDQYAAKTIHPNQPLSYYGLNWTLTDASLQFHIDGRQASKGMLYLILTLKVDNPLLETVIPGSSYNYLQLKTKNASMQLIDSTVPVSFQSGVSGKIGTVTFLVPQDGTSFVLTLSNPAVDGFDASKPVTFQF